ncbi:MAG TPA: DUF3558 family protein [Kutzneria sp.]
MAILRSSVRPSARFLFFISRSVVVTGCLTACASSSLAGDRAPNTSLAAAASTKWNAVDPCSLLAADELRQNNVKTSGQPLNEAGETGCDFLSDTDVVGRALNVTKSPNSPDSYLGRPDDFVAIKANSVNGRPGFQTRISKNNDEGSQYLAVGSAVVSIATTRDPPRTVAAASSRSPVRRALSPAVTGRGRPRHQVRPSVRVIRHGPNGLSGTGRSVLPSQVPCWVGV